MDAAMEILTDLAKAHNIATDSISHFNKGQSEPGDANRVRGASAQKDAARLVYTLSTMSKEEAEQFGVNEIDRPCLVRMDRAKVNFGRAGEAKWFKLIGVNLGNCPWRRPKSAVMTGRLSKNHGGFDAAIGFSSRRSIADGGYRRRQDDKKPRPTYSTASTSRRRRWPSRG
jgi:hypothetical protein